MPMSVRFADSTPNSIPVHIIDAEDFASWADLQTPLTKAWVTTNGFSGLLHQALIIPSPDGSPLMAIAGYGTAVMRKRGRFHLAGAAAKFPKGIYHIASGIAGEHLAQEALGWLLQSYRFDRYKSAPPMAAQLVAPVGVDAAEITALAVGETLTRDLINTPASDMGPPQLEEAARKLAGDFGAQIDVIVGEDLLAKKPCTKIDRYAMGRQWTHFDVSW